MTSGPEGHRGPSAAARVLAAQRGLRGAARRGRTRLHRHRRPELTVLRVRQRGARRPAPHAGRRAGQHDAHRRRGRGPVPVVGRPQPVAGARRRPPRAGLRLLGAGGRHQRARPRAGRQGADARARRRALLAEPVHLHVRGGPRPRSVIGQAGGQRQPDHLVALVERTPSRACPFGGEQHDRPDARPVQGPAVAADSARPGVPCRNAEARAGFGNIARAVGRVERSRPPRRAGYGGRRHRRCGGGGRRGPGDGTRASRAPHLPARPHPLGQCARPDRRADVAGAVGARTRQVAHRGDRPRRRSVAAVGRRTPARPGVATAAQALRCRSR